MKSRKKILDMFVILLVYLTVIGCQEEVSSISEITISLGKAFSLKLNQAAFIINPTVESNDTIMVIINEINDYRCTKECFWAGAAEVAMTVSNNNSRLDLDFCLGDCRIPSPDSTIQIILEDSIYFQFQSQEYLGVLKDLVGEDGEDKVAILYFDRVHQ